MPTRKIIHQEITYVLFLLYQKMIKLQTYSIIVFINIVSIRVIVLECNDVFKI